MTRGALHLTTAVVAVVVTAANDYSYESTDDYGADYGVPNGLGDEYMTSDETPEVVVEYSNDNAAAAAYTSGNPAEQLHTQDVRETNGLHAVASAVSHEDEGYVSTLDGDAAHEEYLLAAATVGNAVMMTATHDQEGVYASDVVDPAVVSEYVDTEASGDFTPDDDALMESTVAETVGEQSVEGQTVKSSTMEEGDSSNIAVVEQTHSPEPVEAENTYGEPVAALIKSTVANPPANDVAPTADDAEMTHDPTGIFGDLMGSAARLGAAFFESGAAATETFANDVEYGFERGNRPPMMGGPMGMGLGPMSGMGMGMGGMGGMGPMMNYGRWLSEIEEGEEADPASIQEEEEVARSVPRQTANDEITQRTQSTAADATNEATVDKSMTVADGAFSDMADDDDDDTVGESAWLEEVSPDDIVLAQLQMNADELDEQELYEEEHKALSDQEDALVADTGEETTQDSAGLLDLGGGLLGGRNTGLLGGVMRLLSTVTLGIL